MLSSWQDELHAASVGMPPGPELKIANAEAVLNFSLLLRTAFCHRFMMFGKRLSVLVILIALSNLSGVFAQADELVVSVTPRNKGPKGTLCNVVGKDGEPTGELVLVRGFFAADARKRDVHHLKVTTQEETSIFRGSDGTTSILNIFQLVSEATAERKEATTSTAEKIQSGDNSEVTRVEKYWMIGKAGEAAVLIPVGWKITRGLNPPIQIALESAQKNVGLSILKEDPVELEVASLTEYTALKRAMLSEALADFEPSE